MHKLHCIAQQIIDMQTQCFNLETMEANTILEYNDFIPDIENTTLPELI